MKEESLSISRTGEWAPALGNVLGHVILGLSCAWIGYGPGRTI